jgi:hypothetical protein
MSTKFSRALAGYAIADMTADFTEFAAAHRVLPATFTATFDGALKRLLQVAAQHQICDLNTLLAKHTLVLRAATGASNLTARLTLDQRAQVHLHRNVLLTVALGAAHIARIDPAGISAAVTTLTRRTQKTDRPFTDDEIALLRTHAVLGLATACTAQAPTVYTLCDAGQELRETTLVTPADVDDVTAPTMVNALGHHKLQARILPLEDFHTHALARRLATLETSAPDRTISYNPRTNQPGSDEAMISVYGVVSRLLEAVGLRQPDVTPSSIRRWRIAQTHDTPGLLAAAEIAGCEVDAVLRLADRTPQRADEKPALAAVTRF